jgi:hypothetical protein
VAIINKRKVLKVILDGKSRVVAIVGSATCPALGGGESEG